MTLYANKFRITSSETLYAITLRHVAGKWRERAVHKDDDHAKTVPSWRTFTAR